MHRRMIVWMGRRPGATTRGDDLQSLVERFFIVVGLAPRPVDCATTVIGFIWFFMVGNVDI